MRKPIEPFLQELKERTFAKYNAFTVGKFSMKPTKNCISSLEKMAFSHRSLTSNKPCWDKKEKAGFDHSLPTADELKGKYFPGP